MKNQKGNSTVIGIVVTVIIIIGIVLISSIRTVPTGYVGVKTRFGKVQEDVMQEGINTKMPFVEKIVKIDCRTQKYETTLEGSSKDLQIIRDVKMAVNYNIRKDIANQLYREVGKDYKKIIVEPAVSESVKSVIAKYTAEELITKREEVSILINDRLVENLNEKGITVTKVSIVDFSFSEEYDKAIERKQVAEQQAKQAEYELEKAKIDNEKKVETAKAEAEMMKVQNQEITENTLRLKELENEGRLIEKWNGQLPTTTAGETIPFLDLR